MTKPNRPPLRYYGSKWRIADWIIGHFAPHDCYVEPFAGAAAVLLRKPRAPLEVLNDLDGQVVNFFRVLRDQPEDLVRLIELTPYAREEWEYCCDEHECDNPVEMARRFYVWSHMSVVNRKNRDGGWRWSRSGYPSVAHRCTVDVAHLYDVAERLRAVQVENGDAFEIIEWYDSSNTLFYVDPPYPISTRSGACYTHELDDADHRRLAELLRGVTGMVAISGYDCDLYDELFSDWSRFDKATTVNSGRAATESLWLSPALVAGRPTLFDL